MSVSDRCVCVVILSLAKCTALVSTTLHVHNSIAIQYIRSLATPSLIKIESGELPRVYSCLNMPRFSRQDKWLACAWSCCCIYCSWNFTTEALSYTNSAPKQLILVDLHTNNTK